MTVTGVIQIMDINMVLPLPLSSVNHYLSSHTSQRVSNRFTTRLIDTDWEVEDIPGNYTDVSVIWHSSEVIGSLGISVTVTATLDWNTQRFTITLSACQNGLCVQRLTIPDELLRTDIGGALDRYLAYDPDSYIAELAADESIFLAFLRRKSAELNAALADEVNNSEFS